MIVVCPPCGAGTFLPVHFLLYRFGSPVKVSPHPSVTASPPATHVSQRSPQTKIPSPSKIPTPSRYRPIKVLYTKNVSQLVTLQRQNSEISKQKFPEKEYRGLSPNFHIHASVSDLYIPTIGLPILLEEICGPILLYKSLTNT